MWVNYMHFFLPKMLHLEKSSREKKRERERERGGGRRNDEQGRMTAVLSSVEISNYS